MTSDSLGGVHYTNVMALPYSREVEGHRPLKENSTLGTALHAVTKTINYRSLSFSVLMDIPARAGGTLLTCTVMYQPGCKQSISLISSCMLCGGTHKSSLLKLRLLTTPPTSCCQNSTSCAIKIIKLIYPANEIYKLS